MRIEVEILDATRGVTMSPVSHMGAKIRPPKLELPVNNNKPGPIKTSPQQVKKQYTNNTTPDIYPPISSNVDIVTKKYTTRNNNVHGSTSYNAFAQQYMNNKSVIPPARPATSRTPRDRSSSPTKSPRNSYSPSKSTEGGFVARPQSSPAASRRKTPPKPVKEHASK